MKYNRTYLAMFGYHPPSWGARGDKYLWLLMCHELIQYPEPQNMDEVRRDISTVYEKITGRQFISKEMALVLGLDGSDEFHLDFLPQEGMSAGVIDASCWREEIVPFLLTKAFWLSGPEHATSD